MIIAFTTGICIATPYHASANAINSPSIKAHIASNNLDFTNLVTRNTITFPIMSA